MWDRIVFYREEKFDRRLRLVAESLPILEKLNSTEFQKDGSREQTEIIRRKILEGISEFVQAGAMTSDLMKRSGHRPEQLLAPQPKLLTAIKTEPEPDRVEVGGTTAEDIRRLEDMLRGMSKEERDAWLRGVDERPSGE
jgi:hypothetical protein